MTARGAAGNERRERARAALALGPGSATALGRGPAAAAWMVPAGIALVVIACFLPTLRNDFVLWDDDLNFTDNPSYRGLSWRQLHWMFTTVHGGHYQPLSWVTLGLDYTLWGMNPTGYHLTSLLLHAVNAVLFYHVVVVLLRRAAVTASAGAAAVGALFFAIHPLRVESVAWASERRDVLSGLFYLATVLAYVRMAAAERTGGARRWYLVSLACFVLSLLSKAWGMTLPIVLVLLDVYPLRRPPRLLEKAPYAVLALGAAPPAVGDGGLGQLCRHRLAGARARADRPADRGRPLHLPRLPAVGGARRRRRPPGERPARADRVAGHGRRPGRARRAHVPPGPRVARLARALGPHARARPDELDRVHEPRRRPSGPGGHRRRARGLRHGPALQPGARRGTERPRHRPLPAGRRRRRDRGLLRGDPRQAAVRRCPREPRAR